MGGGCSIWFSITPVPIGFGFGAVLGLGLGVIRIGTRAWQQHFVKATPRPSGGRGYLSYKLRDILLNWNLLTGPSIGAAGYGILMILWTICCPLSSCDRYHTWKWNFILSFVLLTFLSVSQGIPYPESFSSMPDTKLVVLFVVPDTDTALAAVPKAWRRVPLVPGCIRQIPDLWTPMLSPHRTFHGTIWMLSLNHSYVDF